MPSSKFYIGRHATDKLNDGYYGSGKIIKDYLKTHDLAEFNREILFHAFDIESMKRVEAELIAEHYDHPSCINVGTFIDSLISFEDGRPQLEVVSLKTWCKDNNVKYTSLLASQSTLSYYNGMKLHV